MKINFYILFLVFLNITTALSAVNDSKSIKPKTDLEIIKILKDAEVYPNPAEEFIYVKINNSNQIEDLTIEVMSIIGTKMTVSTEKIKKDLYKLNLKDIPAGHYYVLLTVDKEKSLKKFMKK